MSWRWLRQHNSHLMRRMAMRLRETGLCMLSACYQPYAGTAAVGPSEFVPEEWTRWLPHQQPTAAVLMEPTSESTGSVLLPARPRTAVAGYWVSPGRRTCPAVVIRQPATKHTRLHSVTETGSGPGLFMSLVLVLVGTAGLGRLVVVGPPPPDAFHVPDSELHLIQNCGLRCGRRRAGEHRTDAMVSFHLFGRYLEDGAVERFVLRGAHYKRGSRTLLSSRDMLAAVYWVRTGETCDWMWANSEYRRGKQPRCPARHSPLHPCWAVCWSGAYFYGNPPFDLLTVERTIRKANRDFVKDPEHTVFRFIAPHAHLRTLAPLLVHWEVLHTYPTGSQGVFNYRRDGTYSGAPPVPTTEPEEQLRLRCLEHRYLTRLRSPRDGGSALLHLRRGVEKSGSNSVRAYRV
ncbi:hypothetical protein CYMTET_3196 [Cymbomonas tetramitiformis]|uniref:Uncharacterized protein n=1 Tax=Cymbomonas tetramitiformis TaxID=36881 RepID=A0AAE0LL94_9CHLO|nr:hypothetical protein CYMTET_3196 [Cymbomonas tetramitiformis]